MKKTIFLILSGFFAFPIVIWIFASAHIFKDTEASIKGTRAQLLASPTPNSPYALLEAPSLTPAPINDTRSTITDFQPVTISHTVQKGDSLASIATKYHADSQTIVDYPYNEFAEDLTLKVGQILIIPNGSIDSKIQVPVASGSGVFVWPVQGEISQYSSWWHAGAVDIVADVGKPVFAADSGKVTKAEKLSTGYGWHVTVDHETGYTTLYAHLSKIKVEVGQSVAKGTVLGLVGSTGRSTGPHLHFEVKKDGTHLDPMTLLP